MYIVAASESDEGHVFLLLEILFVFFFLRLSLVFPVIIIGKILGQVQIFYYVSRAFLLLSIHRWNIEKDYANDNSCESDICESDEELIRYLVKEEICELYYVIKSICAKQKIVWIRCCSNKKLWELLEQGTNKTVWCILLQGFTIFRPSKIFPRVSQESIITEQ